MVFMHPLLLHNGELRDTRENFVSPGQVGLLNGWGVFSTIRVYDGVLFAWQRHWDRMARDAKKMRVPMPSQRAMEEQLLKLIDGNKAFNSTLRVCVVRNRGGMFEGPGVKTDFDVIAFTREVNNWGESVKLGIVPQARHAANEFAGTKVLSWAQNLTWYEEAHERGFDEVVLLNERNEVSECTSANIFTVHAGKIFTPALATSGCLGGITRDVILNDLQLDVSEHILLVPDLLNADEMFITSTTREVLPVTYVDEVGHKPIGPVTRRVAEAFAAFTRSYTTQQKIAVTA
jgi:branched-chain amino acid aminotransferase